MRPGSVTSTFLAVRAAGGGRRQDVFDAVLAAVLLCLSLVDLFTHALQGVYPGSRWAHLPFLVLTALPIAVRRYRPLTVLILFALLQSAWIYTLYPLDQQPPLIPFVQLIVVVYSAAAYSDGRVGRAAMVVVAVGVLTDIPTLAIGKPVGQVAGPDVVVAVAFGLGLAFARSRRRSEALEVQAAQAERERIEAAARAAAEERARIARELHDVISHDVSLMVLQASVERRIQRDGPTAQTLATIETTGREALAELRRMMGVLRKHDGVAPLTPQPGMADLPALVEQARAAGIAVELVVDGDPVAVPPGLDIAAYRIVQESITNAAKHAPGASVTAVLRYRDRGLEIDVVNDMGRDAATVPLPRGGHGLVGMQERVDLFGGHLEATPEASGGFRVRARIPLRA